VLVQGVTFKENVSDIRNSKVFDLIQELDALGFSVDAIDPFANPKEVELEYGVQLKESNELKCRYDALIIAVAHTDYVNQDRLKITNFLCDNGVIVDIKGIVKDAQVLETYTYWRM
jgi:UDP-N-acetyl-D-galactosamine dehydrogenase